jgi:hypothetical protein
MGWGRARGRFPAGAAVGWYWRESVGAVAGRKSPRMRERRGNVDSAGALKPPRKADRSETRIQCGFGEWRRVDSNHGPRDYERGRGRRERRGLSSGIQKGRRVSDLTVSVACGCVAPISTADRHRYRHRQLEIGSLELLERLYIFLLHGAETGFSTDGQTARLP